MSADAAYRSPVWRGLPAGMTFTTRLPVNAVLYGPAPPRTGRRGRPRAKGERLGTPAELAAATAPWRTATIHRYGVAATVELAVIEYLWYGSLRATPVHVILIREPGSTSGYDIALVTTDVSATGEDIACRYANRWLIEQSIEDGKDLLGAGETQNRGEKAVQRSVLSTLLCQTILLLWYVHTGDAASDIAARHNRAPWYTRKASVSLDDMLIAFRRARISEITPAHNATAKNTYEPLTCSSTAA